jgi:NAD(P)-dependent dehydrogenase (short-subunit alcohol dehydrogenase family)
VVIADIEDGTIAVEGIKEAGGDAGFVKVDVSKSTDIQALVRTTVKAYGRLDFAVNNAGIGGPSATTGDYTEQDWNRVIGINLTGVWLCMKYELEQMSAGQRRSCQYGIHLGLSWIANSRPGR